MALDLGRVRRSLSTRDGDLTFGQRILGFRWLMLLLLAALVAIGVATLYSAGRGSFSPWADRQLLRFGVGLTALVVVALTDFRIWLRFAYAIYGVGLLLLVAVETIGTTAMGAQRWLDLGPVNIQPSELMKIAMVLALARYFHGLTLEAVARPHYLIPPLLMVFAPAILVMKQPDLGTALTLVLGGGAMFYLAGVRMWKFALVIAGALAAMPFLWERLRDYQKRRILMFLNPESDPLGAGYHIIQSKIALGSGGIFGKGFMQGTQSHLNFLPEKQTDFIFTMLAEEWGMVGGVFLLLLYAAVLGYGFALAVRIRHQFGRLVAMGIVNIMFIYVFVNIGMVMGVLPVVGIPLPLISYGGSAMLTLMAGFGLLIGAYIHREAPLGT
ncbi:MAG: rod shape-determining protein RodA [Alphaproteobacteria bacterium]|nr:rod shape-determining protein RodA [Alphaproteobacteria bacterium]